nr:DUF1569 domain-containing protein [uncultured Polaribacter sp.]
MDTNQLKNTLLQLKTTTKPLFGKMNAQQMIEHLSLLMQVSCGKIAANHFVEEEKSKRRKTFLDTEEELQIGFKAPLLSEEPTPVKFESIEIAIEDLVSQIIVFQNHFKTAKTENHPFFGELDNIYWTKFHTKHFTHHFKQFGLL